MSESSNRAVRRRQARLSPIWIVPLVAVLIGLWMVYDNYVSRGPVVTLILDTAEGIEAGKTLVKARNVEVGSIASVTLSDDLSHTIAEVHMKPGSERMLTSNTRFWVVKPRIDREGISGLSTVLSGAYIELLPGRSGEPRRRYEVLQQPPIASADASGLRLKLVSALGNSLRVGDPVTYQGFTVGRVESSELDPVSREAHHGLFIEAAYESLITDTTRFWGASGVALQLDSTGFNLKLESFETLVTGGVTFGVPDEVMVGQPVTSGHRFTLYTDQESASQGTYDRYLEYVLLVDDTVRGLDAGAPVEYRGVRVGTVTSVPWRFTAPQPGAPGLFAIPVLIHFEPQRFDDTGGDFDQDEWRDRLGRMFERGLRATLKTGNYLTQALYVDLAFSKDETPYSAKTFVDKPVFPTESGGLGQISEQVSGLLDKLNNLQVEPILKSLDGNLRTSEETLQEVRRSAAAIQGLLAEPAIQNLPGNLNDTLGELRETLQGFSAGSAGYQELTGTLGSLKSLLDELQPIARTLREKPNALIFNSPDTEDPQPRAPQ